MDKQLDASQNLAMFDKMRTVALESADAAIACVKEMLDDEDFAAFGEKNLEKLEYSRHILQNNTLPLSLMASFQKGKSTTTSAMADGHEITPCGKGGGGIRTSSIPVTIYNNEHSTEVQINVYPNIVLVQHILDCCATHLDNADPSAYDLESDDSRRLLYEGVKKEIACYASTSDYTPDKVPVLRNAVLILSYFGSKSHQRLLNNEFRTVADIQPFIAFPEDLETRWKYLRDYGFDIVNQKGKDGKLLFDELSSLHVFINNIVVPVHSEFMGETGTAIIDAPGTMASNEDTERALNAAANAAVVLFLVTGETQLSKADLDMLRSLKNAGMSSKVVFIVNFFKNPEVIKENIEETILAQIREAGYTDKHHGKLLYYNAFLAQRAAQGLLLLENQMDSLTAQAIITDAKKRRVKFSTVEEAWLKTTLKVLRSIDADDMADELSEQGLCQETVDSIQHESNWKEMVTSLREFVMTNRAAGVLKDLGVQPVHDGLKFIEEALAQREKAASDTEEQVKEEYDKAKKLLDEFSDEVEDVVAINLSQSADKIFAESYYDDVVLAAIDVAAEAAAPEIFKQTGLMGNLADIGDKLKRLGEKSANAVTGFVKGKRYLVEHDPNGLKEKCNAIISSHYRRAITEKGHAWSQNLEASVDYTENIKNKVRHIRKLLSKTWENLELGKNELLSDNFPAPDSLTGLISKEAVSIEVIDIVSNTAAAAQTELASILKFLGTRMGTVVCGTWIYFFILPADFVIPGFAEIITVVSVALATLVYAISHKKRELKIEFLKEEIKSGLSKTVASEKKKIVERIMKGDRNADPPALGVSYIRLFYVTLFEAIIEQQRLDLDNVYNEKLNDLRKSSEDRDRIARKANNWRTKRIEPIRRKLAGMLDDIGRIWG